jgi:hypothetical protein
MKTPKARTSGPFADPARAAEIASMDAFGLLEFTELTGIGAGDYGNYRISTSGVSLLLAADFKELDLSNWSTEEQLIIQRAAQAPALIFPCSPEAFMSWYDATRGEDNAGNRGASDFPLAEAFEKGMRRREGASSDRSRFSCPSNDIIAAFAVKPEPEANANWWRARLSDPRKYGGPSFVGARASKGDPRNPSRWYPDVVAGWLIEARHLSLDAAIQSMKRSFPEVDSTLLG